MNINLSGEIIISPTVVKCLIKKNLKTREQVWLLFCSTIPTLNIHGIIEGKNEDKKPDKRFYISASQIDLLSKGNYFCILTHSHPGENSTNLPTHEDIIQFPLHKKLIGGCVYHPIKKTLAFYNKGKKVCKVIDISKY